MSTDVVLVALALDPALALLDLRRQPGHVEVMERLQPKLRVDAGPHRVGGADQEADLAGAHVAEQALLGLGLLEILHEGDFGRRHAQADELVADPAIGREAARLLDADGAEIGEDHLRGAGQLVGACRRRARRCSPPVSCQMRKALATSRFSLLSGFVVVVRIDEAQIDRGVASVGDDGEQDVVAGLRRLDRAFSIALMRASSRSW